MVGIANATPLILALISAACAGAGPAAHNDPPQPHEPVPVTSSEPDPEAGQPVEPLGPAAAPGEHGPAGQRPLPGAIWPPPGYEPPPCELELSTVSVKRGKRYQVSARVRNVGKRPIEFKLPDRCPLGAIAFVGLPEGYDYYGGCTRGACAGPRPDLKFRVDAGKTLELATIEVDPGTGGCNQSLPGGKHHVGFSLPRVPQTCNLSWGAIDVPESKARTPAPLPTSAPRSGTFSCPPMQACGLSCPGGDFARDANGCAQCACADSPVLLAPP